MDNYKQFASNYPNGKKRLDPLVNKQLRQIGTSSKLSSSRMNSVGALNTSLPSIQHTNIAILSS